VITTTRDDKPQGHHAHLFQKRAVSPLVSASGPSHESMKYTPHDDPSPLSPRGHSKVIGFGQVWCNTTAADQPYPTKPQNDTLVVAQALLDKYCSEDVLTDNFQRWAHNHARLVSASVI
jgi:hypothetical protein